MKVLITGACGFLGRYLIKELESAHELVLVDRTPPEKATVFVPGSSERKLSPLMTKWPFVQADIMDPVAIRKAVAGTDAVIHLAAAVTGLPEFGTETMNFNVIGTFNVLDACRLAGAKRFLCASSINAFGTIYWRLSNKPAVYTSLPLTEEVKTVVEDPYSLSKLVNEETCATFYRAYGMTTAAFRFAGVWTEEMYDNYIKQKPAPVTAWSDDLFQWVHCKDIVTGLRQALEARDLPGFGVYTLGAADTRCAEPTMEVIEKTRPEMLRTLTRPLVGREPLLSIAKAQAAFGYQPRYRGDIDQRYVVANRGRPARESLLLFASRNCTVGAETPPPPLSAWLHSTEAWHVRAVPGWKCATGSRPAVWAVARARSRMNVALYAATIPDCREILIRPGDVRL